ncbi:hypothetical protein EVAR_72732_1, partial [Eumeta japonica]
GANKLQMMLPINTLFCEVTGELKHANLKSLMFACHLRATGWRGCAFRMPGV